ncbi:MAG: rhodanese-like domain-containing protein [bacterium]
MKILKTFLIIFGLFSSIVYAQSYQDISAQEAKMIIYEMPELIILDVSPMYDQGHIPEAVNYFIGDGTLAEALEELDKSKTYLVYCHTDEASIAGAEMMIKSGFKEVYRLQGNFIAWILAGYEIRGGLEDNQLVYWDLTPEQIVTLQQNNPDLVIIDVSPVYDQGHLPGAINYPLGDGSFEEVIPNLDRSLPYLIYCHGDQPAITASLMLNMAGFSRVYRLLGNFQAWVDAGMEVEK